MACTRLQIITAKKSNLVKNSKKEISNLLRQTPPAEEKARIRAEALIREDNCIEAYEILELEAELVSERMKLICSEKTCPSDLISCISTLIWASFRVDVQELGVIKSQFKSKYGKKFIQAACDNDNRVLNDRVVSKLDVRPPVAFLVESYLKDIANENGIEWEPKEVEFSKQNAPMEAPSGFSVPSAPGSGFSEIHAQVVHNDINVEPVAPPSKNLPAGWDYTEDGLLSVNDDAGEGDEAGREAAGGAVEGDKDDNKDDNKKEAGKKKGDSGGDDDYDDLAARFNALKK